MDTVVNAAAWGFGAGLGHRAAGDAYDSVKKGLQNSPSSKGSEENQAALKPKNGGQGYQLPQRTNVESHYPKAPARKSLPPPPPPRTPSVDAPAVGSEYINPFHPESSTDVNPFAMKEDIAHYGNGKPYTSSSFPSVGEKPDSKQAIRLPAVPVAHAVYESHDAAKEKEIDSLRALVAKLSVENESLKQQVVQLQTAKQDKRPLSGSALPPRPMLRRSSSSVKLVYDFSPSQDPANVNQLQGSQGDTFELLKGDGNGWLTVRNGDQQGIIPKAYCEPLHLHQDGTMSA